MSVVGRVESLWRYPVKSMRGEELREAFVGFAGVYGDRTYALHDTAAPKGFPYLTGREQGQMLLYRPRYRRVRSATKPPNVDEAEALAPGLTPVYADAADMTVDVETPNGETLPIDDPKLLALLSEGLSERHQLSLLRSDRAMTDCRPISLFSVQTARQLGEELGVVMDKRRFRANVYLDLGGLTGFSEDGFAGLKLRIGERAVVAVLERDPRCKMITLDADTGEANPEVMKVLARSHEGKAGVYGAVLVEAMIRPGDEVTVVQ